MKCTYLFLFIFSVLLSEANLFGNSIENYRLEVLDHRVSDILLLHEQALQECGVQYSTESLKQLTEGLPSKLIYKLNVLKQLNQWNISSRCQSSFQKLENKQKLSEKKLFISLRNAITNQWFDYNLFFLPGLNHFLKKLEQELNPYCRINIIPDYNGTLERNPCFAGDEIVINTLWKKDSHQYSYLQINAAIEEYLLTLYNKVSKAEKFSSIDLWDDYPFKENRKLFLAFLALLYATSSSDSGYVDGFGEYAWRKGLERSPENAISEYLFIKEAKDFHLNLLKLARKKYLLLKVQNYNNEITHFNRHDFMAAFLSCHYAEKNYNTIAKWVPQSIGTIYEILDFFSHNQSELRKNFTNFQIDVKRYLRSSEWGYEFCVGSIK